jgi:hypothetical protein
MRRRRPYSTGKASTAAIAVVALASYVLVCLAVLQ